MTYNLAVVAVPAIIAMTFSLLVQIINLSLIGHLNDASIVAGVGLGNLYVNMFSQSLYTGLNGAIATFVS